ncbi:MAG: nucleoside 2-deoxyribosyltransferase [Bdellovibrionales bacterium]
MKIYLGVKYYPDNSNKNLIDTLSSHLEKQGHQVSCVVRDIEHWGDKVFAVDELMRKTFEMIDNSDAVLIELTEKGVGLGIEAGYAFSKGIPITVVAKLGSDISSTIKGISKSVISYSDIKEIAVV